jgi:hypothetical protein
MLTNDWTESPAIIVVAVLLISLFFTAQPEQRQAGHSQHRPS